VEVVTDILYLFWEAGTNSFLQIFEMVDTAEDMLL
jgi:hypothetical protein